MMKRIILITGPAGVGKTTVAEEWAKRQDYHTIHISLDSMRERVTSGFQHAQAGWNDETERQYQIARAACAAVAKIYYENDFTGLSGGDYADWNEWMSMWLSGKSAVPWRGYGGGLSGAVDSIISGCFNGVRGSRRLWGIFLRIGS